MSLIKSTQGSDQLLLDSFRYRRDRSVWPCVKVDCKGRARPDGITCKMYNDHIYVKHEIQMKLKKLYIIMKLRRKSHNVMIYQD